MDKNNKSAWGFLGSWGFFWRALLFLLGMALISFLLALLLWGRIPVGGSGTGGNIPVADSLGRVYTDPYSPDYPGNINNPNDPNSPYNPDNPNNPYTDPDNPDNPYREYPPELVNPAPVQDWNEPITGVPELPSPEDNYMPPVDSTRYVPDPDDPYGKIIDDQLIVYFNSQDIKADMTSFARQFKSCYPGNEYQIAYYNTTTACMLLTVPPARLSEVLNELPSKITGIDFVVVTNGVLAESAKPSDPDFAKASYDEYFRLIQAYEAWDITKGSSDVKVAIVDSYFDLGNAEIGQRYVDPIHIPSKTTLVLPPANKPTLENFGEYCHGSHVAGIAIGAQDNGRGVSGIAPGCSWIPVALGNEMSIFNLMEGILYAVYRGADVINLSLGRYFTEEASKLPIADQIFISQSTDKRGEQLWDYIYKTAEDHGCVIVTAAGNEQLLMGMDPMNRSSHIIKVEAVDGKGKHAFEFSNFGQDPSGQVNYSTVAAPGVNLWSATDARCAPFWRLFRTKVSPRDGLQEMSGTSMASPVVTGAVALLKSKNKDLKPDQIIKILTMTAKQTDQSGKIGPTIQIRDALDATGGELLNFDDLMADHNMLLGKWRSTHELHLENAATGERLDDIWAYFIFSSTSSGVLQMHAIKGRKVYEAPLSVTWSNQEIVIRQLSDAVAPDGDKVNKDDFVCHPSVDRLLEASGRRGGQERYVFKLEKVN